MQNDIIPPNLRRPNSDLPKSGPMPTLRLMGHSAEDAKKRLVKEENRATPASKTDKETRAVAAFDGLSRGRRKPHEWVLHHISKRSKIELVALAVVTGIGSGVLVLLVMHFAQKPQIQHVASNPVVKPSASPKPNTVASPLSGVQVSPDLAKRPVTGIMIENSPDARPQSGLQDAGVVYEAIAEGGITRFMALFQDSRPSYIGPVRSLRPYYIDFGWPYQASIAHVGGSPDALSQIRSGGFRDLDQFFNSGAYSRIGSRTAPHNVYTDFNRLDQLNQSKGFNSSNFTPWPRKDDKPAATPTDAHIDVRISSPIYYSHYDYDKASNTYNRSEGGKPHVQVTSANDRSGTLIHPKVVVAVAMSYGVIDRAGHSNYGVTGSGPIKVFQDGTVIDGTWSKSDRSDMFHFKDSSGSPISLDAGQTWVVAVSGLNEVSAAP
jgi:hypothetical protein